MISIAETDVTPASRWTLRVALFSGAIIVAAAAGHRLLGMSTPVALNLFKLGLAGAGAALLIGLWSLFRIWRDDARGVLATTFGALIAFSIFAWPVSYAAVLRDLPELNDLTTDVQQPPQFVALKDARGGGANPDAYPGVAFARRQSEAYPDLRALVVNRSAEEMFELAHRVATRIFKMRIIGEAVPGATPGQPGRIEAIDRTPVLGFYDDVVVRIAGDANRARVDIRSASRYGRHDLGRNASRIRRFLRELQAHVDMTTPSSSGERIARLRSRLGARLAVPKRAKGADPGSTVPKTAQDRARSDAPRAPEQKVRQRVPDERQSRDTRPQPPVR